MKYFEQYYFSEADQLTARHTQPTATSVRPAVELVDGSFKRSLAQALKDNHTDSKIGILLSGGVDSSLLLAMLKHFADKEIVCFTATSESDDPDFLPSKEVARAFGSRWVSCRIKKSELTERLSLLLPLSNGGLYGTAGDLALDACLDQCQREGINNLWSGNGLDMLFGGGVDPHGFKADSYREFHKLFWEFSFSLLRERFYYQSGSNMNKLASNYGIKLVMPFENLDSIVTARSIRADLFFKYDEDKYPVRLLAHRYGVPFHESRRPKDPLQHSSGIFELLREYMYETLPEIINDPVNFKITPEYFRANPNTDLQIFLALLAHLKTSDFKLQPENRHHRLEI